jgi:hypothetical protein
MKRQTKKQRHKQKIAMLISINKALQQAKLEHNTRKIHKLNLELAKIKDYLRK